MHLFHKWVEKTYSGLTIVNRFMLHGIVTKERSCFCGKHQVCVDDCGGAFGEQWITVANETTKENQQ